jgi:hypothetical protein
VPTQYVEGAEESVLGGIKKGGLEISVITVEVLLWSNSRKIHAILTSMHFVLAAAPPGKHCIVDTKALFQRNALASPFPCNNCTECTLAQCLPIERHFVPANLP